MKMIATGSCDSGIWTCLMDFGGLISTASAEWAPWTVITFSAIATRESTPRLAAAMNRKGITRAGRFTGAFEYRPNTRPISRGSSDVRVSRSSPIFVLPGFRENLREVERSVLESRERAGEVHVPCPDSRFALQARARVPLPGKVGDPAAQGDGVILAVCLRRDDPEPGLLQVRELFRQRDQLPMRKDVALGEGVAPEPVPTRFLPDDGLVQVARAGGQTFPHQLEEARRIAFPDVLVHPDAGGRREVADRQQPTVIPVANLDATGPGARLPGVLVLRPGGGDPDAAASVLRACVSEEGTPSASDIKNPGVLVQAQLGADDLVLAVLRVRQRLRSCGEHAARVEQGGAEQMAVELSRAAIVEFRAGEVTLNRSQGCTCPAVFDGRGTGGQYLAAAESPRGPHARRQGNTHKPRAAQQRFVRSKRMQVALGLDLARDP